MNPLTPSRRVVLVWLSSASVVGCGPKKNTDPGRDGGCCHDGDTSDGSGGSSSSGTTDSDTSDRDTSDRDTSDRDSGRDDTADSGTPDTCRTEGDIEGPYYTPSAPERADLTEGETGTAIEVRGTIVHTDCTTPRGGAVFDVWHADDAGAYDNEGMRLRGRITCDEDGRFTLKTVLPGRYDVRPVRHIHFKIWDRLDGEELVTSQFYFSGDPEYNAETHTGPLVEISEDGLVEVILAV